MNTVGTFLAGPVGSWLRVAVSTVLTLLLVDLKTNINPDWTAYAIAAVIAVIPPVLAWLNPQDPRFGNGLEPAE